MHGILQVMTQFLLIHGVKEGSSITLPASVQDIDLVRETADDVLEKMLSTAKFGEGTYTDPRSQKTYGDMDLTDANGFRILQLDYFLDREFGRAAEELRFERYKPWGTRVLEQV